MSDKFRPTLFWSWNDKLDKTEIKRQIREMNKAGFGGFYMHPRTGLITSYLSDEFMECVATATDEAKALNMDAWLYDEDRYPSGTCSDEVVKNPKFVNRYLALLLKEQMRETDIILKETTYCGEVYFICVRTMEGINLYVDLLNPETTKEFINLTHEKYKTLFQGDFGKTIPGIFTDEPCFIRHTEMTVPTIPWTADFAKIFEQKKKYSILDKIEQMFFDIKGYQQTRYDFYEVATKLLVESFGKQVYQWCEQNNLEFTGHYLGENGLFYQTESIGSAMQFYEYMHMPGIDDLGNSLGDIQIVKQLTSVKKQLGKNRCICECFGGMGQNSSPFDRKWIGDWLIGNGIDQLCYHLSSYTMAGERKRDFAPNIFFQQPYWEVEKSLSDYFSKLANLLNEGVQEDEVLVIHPMGTGWRLFTPLGRSSRLQQIENEFRKITNCLNDNYIPFDYADEILLEKYGKYQDGAIVIGEKRYSKVVIPPMIGMRENTYNLIGKLEKSNVILVKSLKEQIYVDGIAIDESKFTKTYKVDQVLQLLNENAKYPIVIDTVTNKPAKDILLTKRTKDGKHFYFVSNSNKVREISLKITLYETSMPKLLDLLRNLSVNGNVEQFEDKICILITMQPAESIVIDFREVAEIKSAKTMPYKNAVLTNLEFEGENALAISDISLKINGELVIKNGTIGQVHHNYFYNLPDGTEFEAEYKFFVKDLSNSNLMAAIEKAKNLDEININGVVCKPSDEIMLDDESFQKVKFNGIKGENTVVIKGRKYNSIVARSVHKRISNYKNYASTEIEKIYILGDFYVDTFDGANFFIDKQKKASGNNITKTGYPFYAGSVKYSYIADVEEPSCGIMINNLNFVGFKVVVNDEDLGYVIMQDKKIFCNIKQGKNTIILYAYNTLHNLMGANNCTNILEKTFSNPGDFYELDRYTEKKKMVDYGINSVSILKTII